MPVDRTSKPIPGPNVPLWRRPLFAVLTPELRKKEISAGEIQKQAAELCDPKEIEKVRDMFPNKLKWLGSLMVFLCKQNLIAAGGIAAVVVGALSLVVSFLKPLLKWGGITLGGLGVIAAIGGKLCGISLESPGASAPASRSSNSSDDDIMAGAAAAAFSLDGHDGHGDCGHDCGDASFG